MQCFLFICLCPTSAFKSETVCPTLPKYNLKSFKYRGAWVAQSVKHLTLDFGSGHDLAIWEFKPRIGICADGEEPA